MVRGFYFNKGFLNTWEVHKYRCFNFLFFSFFNVKLRNFIVINHLIFDKNIRTYILLDKSLLFSPRMSKESRKKTKKSIKLGKLEKKNRTVKKTD